MRLKKYSLVHIKKCIADISYLGQTSSYFLGSKPKDAKVDNSIHTHIYIFMIHNYNVNYETISIVYQVISVHSLKYFSTSRKM